MPIFFCSFPNISICFPPKLTVWHTRRWMKNFWMGDEEQKTFFNNHKTPIFLPRGRTDGGWAGGPTLCANSRCCSETIPAFFAPRLWICQCITNLMDFPLTTCCTCLPKTIILNVHRCFLLPFFREIPSVKLTRSNFDPFKTTPPQRSA